MTYEDASYLQAGNLVYVNEDNEELVGEVIETFSICDEPGKEIFMISVHIDFDDGSSLDKVYRNDEVEMVNDDCYADDSEGEEDEYEDDDDDEEQGEGRNKFTIDELESMYLTEYDSDDVKDGEDDEVQNFLQWCREHRKEE